MSTDLKSIDAFAENVCAGWVQLANQSIFALQFAEQCRWSRAQVKRCSQFLGKVIRAAVVRKKV